MRLSSLFIFTKSENIENSKMESVSCEQGVRKWKFCSEYFILIIGYFTAVTLCNTTLVSVALLPFRTGGLFFDVPEPDFLKNTGAYADNAVLLLDRNWQLLNYAMAFATISLHMFLAGAFVFTCFLIYGIHTNRPSYVLSYMVAGVVMTVLIVVSTVLGLARSHVQASDKIVGFTLFGCLIYNCYLIWVCDFYRKMSRNYQKNLFIVSDNLVDDMQILVEKTDKMKETY